MIFPTRYPLHCVLSAVSFQGQRASFLAVAVHPESAPNAEAQPTTTTTTTTSTTTTMLESLSSSVDVIQVSCLVLQVDSAEWGADFVKDLKDVFVAAMRAKSPVRNSSI